MQRIPPQVTLRAIREAMGLTTPMLAEKISERGINVHPDHLLNVELGRKRASNALLVAWANVLRINPRDIRQAAELKELVGEDEPDGAAA